MGALAPLRPAVAAGWLTGSRWLAQLRLDRDAATRDLSRIAIVAALRRHNGIAQGARLQHAALERQGHDVQLLDATAALRSPLARTPHVPATAYVFHCGGPQTAPLLQSVLPAAARAWRIGYWAWELPDPPADWRAFGSLVNEIWTPSRFAAESLGRMFPCPIRVVGHVVESPPFVPRSPGVPFTVLTMADSRSSFARKNPLAAILAFRAAFGGSENARLIVKLNGSGPDAEAIRTALIGLPHQVVSEFLDDEGIAALYRSADALLSLHRAEGFGLPILEAMAHGLPVIGTNWSGNTDFMTEANSLPVPYSLVPVEDSAEIYSGSVWAEPDVAAAALLLRRLADDKALYAKLSGAAHRAASEARLTLP
ncbi:MAG: glycosyltransferase family 4 protein [Pseudomonadota bacterium]